MKLTPKTEKEISEANLLPKGTYDFEIAGAEEQISKAGNDMIKLTLRIYNDDGNYSLVNDYLMEMIPGKLRHCAEACGLLDDYERGRLDADDMRGKSGKLKLVIKKDKNGQYPDQNSVQDYLAKPEHAAAPNSQRPTASSSRPASKEDFDDEIPF